MVILLLGNITFHHFVDEELALFKTDKVNKALCHKLDSITFHEDSEQAYILGDEEECYIVLPDFEGELIFEREEDLTTYKSFLNLNQL